MISIEKLVGLKVITSRAFSLGIVKGARLDTENWKITHLHVKLDDNAATRLGFKKRFRSSIVCVPVDMIAAVGDFVTIGRSLDELSRTQEIIECRE
jgi:sporulation protein YlmC with PRC-barrel domain